MRFRPRRGSWILLVVFLFTVAIPSFSSATQNPGLVVTVYNNVGYNGSPPLPDITGTQEVGTTNVSNVNQNFDSNPLFNMYEDFIVKYEGHITSPISTEVFFLATADDGTKLIIDNQLIDDNWVDKGGGGNISQPVYFNAGESKTFLYWFYENGGRCMDNSLLEYW